jgi:deoxycytidine triphosphate deaminase
MPTFIPLNNKNQISLDLTLDRLFDIEKQELVFSDSLVLQPRTIYFATYNEKIEMAENQVGVIDGKSSLARMGLNQIKTDQTSFFNGQVPRILALTALLPIRIYKELPIAQLIISENGKESEKSAIVRTTGKDKNLTLSKELYMYTLKDGEILDSKSDNSKYLKKVRISRSGFALEQNTLYLGMTNEEVSVENCIARLSTPGIKNPEDTALLGLSIEFASLIKDGWKGRIALEISSVLPETRLYPNMTIGTLDILGSTSREALPEQSRYNNQKSPKVKNDNIEK